MSKKIGYFQGRQDAVSARVARLLLGDNATARQARQVLEFIRVQRALAQAFPERSSVVMWRGIGIETAPRRVACWVQSPRLLARWRKNTEVEA